MWSLSGKSMYVWFTILILYLLFPIQAASSTSAETKWQSLSFWEGLVRLDVPPDVQKCVDTYDTKYWCKLDAKSKIVLAFGVYRNSRELPGLNRETLDKGAPDALSGHLSTFYTSLHGETPLNAKVVDSNLPNGDRLTFAAMGADLQKRSADVQRFYDSVNLSLSQSADVGGNPPQRDDSQKAAKISDTIVEQSDTVVEQKEQTEISQNLPLEKQVMVQPLPKTDKVEEKIDISKAPDEQKPSPATDKDTETIVPTQDATVPQEVISVEQRPEKVDKGSLSSSTKQERLAEKLYRRIQTTNITDIDTLQALYKQVITHCPKTKQAEESYMRLSDLYLKNPTQPRYREAIETLQEFQENYPDSEYSAQAGDMLTTALKESEKVDETTELEQQTTPPPIVDESENIAEQTGQNNFSEDIESDTPPQAETVEPGSDQKDADVEEEIGMIAEAGPVSPQSVDEETDMPVSPPQPTTGVADAPEETHIAAQSATGPFGGVTPEEKQLLASPQTQTVVPIFEMPTGFLLSGEDLLKQGMDFARAKKWDKARDVFFQATMVEPNNPRAWVNLGLVLRKQGKNDLAIHSYYRAIKADASFGLAYKNLGVALEKAGYLKSALSAYRDYLRVAEGTTDTSAVKARADWLETRLNRKGE